MFDTFMASQALLSGKDLSTVTMMFLQVLAQGSQWRRFKCASMLLENLKNSCASQTGYSSCFLAVEIFARLV